jgi:hypothetical protein
MPTSVHIPPKLLKRADKRAKALGISRNKLIVQALERELSESSGWNPGFFERFQAVDAETAKLFDESMKIVRKSRSSKVPPTF